MCCGGISGTPNLYLNVYGFLYPVATKCLYSSVFWCVKWVTMISKNNKRIQVVLTKDEVKKIEKMAKDDDRSSSYIVAKLVRKALKR